MKKLVSLALALSLVLTLSLTAFAAPVTVKGNGGSITFSVVNSTETKTLSIRGESRTVTVYYVPVNCVVTYNFTDASSGYTYYSGSNGNYSPSGGGGIGMAQGTFTFEYAHGELTSFITGGVTYYMIIGSGSGPSTTQTQTTAASANTTPQQPASRTSADGMVHTVKAGDTLSSIALNYYGDMSLWRELETANKEYLAQTKDGRIFVGFNLVIPATLSGKSALAPAVSNSGETLYTVKAGDTLGTIAQEQLGNMNRSTEIFNRNRDRVSNVNTIYEGQIIVIPAR